jgi:hypothetical protein
MKLVQTHLPAKGGRLLIAVLTLLILALASLPPAPALAHDVQRAAPAAAPAAVLPTLKVYVEQDGIVQITAANLTAAGWTLAGLDPRTIKLTRLGSELPIRVEGQDDGVFDAADVILFYGQAMTGPYTRRNVYWLTAGGAPGLRMAERDVAPTHSYPVAASFRATLHAEQDNISPAFGYWQNPPGKDAQDHWYWTAVLAAPTSAALAFQLPAFDPAGSAALRVLLAGKTNDLNVNPDHHTRILLNGTQVDDKRWDGAIEFQHATTISPALLLAGANTVTVVLPGDTGATVNSLAAPAPDGGPPLMPPQIIQPPASAAAPDMAAPDATTATVDQLYANWLEVDYAARYQAASDRLFFKAPGTGAYQFRITGFTVNSLEAYDITNPAAPVRLLNATAPKEGATYTAVLEDTAAAGAAYLAQTQAQRRAPAGIVADAFADLRNPTNAADEIIVTYDGFATDIQPLAAQRQAQGLRVKVVTMTDIYDEFGGGLAAPQALRDFLAFAYANWARPAPAYVLLVGDANQDYLDRFKTGGANFVPTWIFDAAEVGQTANDTWFAQVAGAGPPFLAIGRLPARSTTEVQTMVAKILAYEAAPSDAWRSRTLFVADLVALHVAVSDYWTGLVPLGYEVQRVYAASYPPGSPTTDIIAAVNQGRFLVTYMGHGNTDRWGTWSGGRIFDVTNIPSLTSSPRLPFVLTANCFNGFFTQPFTEATMAETLVRQAGGGAIAAWSPTALGSPGEQSQLFSYLYDVLLNGAPPTLGAATLQAKQKGYAQALPAELMETFILFGDPALRLQRAQPTVVADLRASKSGTNVALTWSDVGSIADHYEVWRGNKPYFAPTATEGTLIASNVPRAAHAGDPINVTDQTSHLGNPDINDYYVVLAVSASGQKSVISNRVGGFDFRLEPGG